MGLSLSDGAMALDSDRDQPIQIVADVAIRDELAGETRYEGNGLTQGSLVITADTLSIRHNTDDADKIVATGEPATLVQQPTPDQARSTPRHSALNTSDPRILSGYWKMRE